MLTRFSCLQLQQLRRQLHEKDWALQDITEACEAEKSAFQKALEATQEHRDSNQRDALRLKAQLAELSHLVEQLKQVHPACVSLVSRTTATRKDWPLTQA